MASADAVAEARMTVATFCGAGAGILPGRRAAHLGQQLPPVLVPAH